MCGYGGGSEVFIQSEKIKPVQRQPYTSYNLFFFIPFLCWMVAGAVCLVLYDKQEMFAAVNMRHTPFRDIVMHYASRMGEGAVIVVVLLVLMGISTFRNWWYFTTALLCNVVPALITQMLKRMYDSPRPLRYFNDAAWIHVGMDWPRLYHNSFPSGHTTGAFSFFCFLACFLPPRYRFIGIGLFLIALLVGFSRIYLAAHFFADIYAGSIMGTCIALLILMVMNYFRPRFFKTNDPVTTTGAL